MNLRPVAAAVGVSALLAGSALAAPLSSARLAVVAKSPLTLRATGFHAGEHVSVFAATNGASARKVVTATGAGQFVARFLTLKATGCASITARATGDRGSTAMLKIIPECPQPITP